MQKICIKAQSCRTAPSCQHGRPHNECADCSVRECFVGGQVRCKPYKTAFMNQDGDTLGDKNYAQ
jgi:hypothetical protein